MKVDLSLGKYVVAVSGGVDSMVLLDLVRKLKDVEIVAAHFDHGIRADSDLDRKLVEETAKKYGLEFEYAEVKLGKNASEEVARHARYKFLHKTRDKYGAIAIITAHHQDDLIETAFINLLRGTGRKGLSSLQSTELVKRPLLKYSKQEIIKYANTNKLAWREDETNQDEMYLRNYIRKKVLPKLTQTQRDEFIESLDKTNITNKKLDLEIAKLLQLNKTEINKQLFNSLPHDIAGEVMAEWLRGNNIREFDSKSINRLVIGAKTMKIGQQMDVRKNSKILIGKTKLDLRHTIG